MTRAPRTRRLCCALFFCSIAACGLAQQPATTPPQTPTAASQPTPPQLLLGQKAESLRRATKALSTLVIVRDDASYIAAIEAWSPNRIFPVLIDDGSIAAQERIGMFARAFRPARIVEWRAPSAPADAGPASFARVDPPTLERALARAWDVTPTEDAAPQRTLLDAWKAGGWSPIGVVVTGRGDPAWPAALALAAGRAQPIIFIEARRQPSGWLKHNDARELARSVQTAVDALGLPRKGVGEAGGIDSVALCLNAPVKFSTPGDSGRELLALSDLVGREATDDAARWAWAGQIIGDAPQAAYQAMCSLFLQPARAWLFDGYQDKPPFSTFDATAAARIFEELRFPHDLHDSPANSAREWRRRALRPLNAELVFVNTSGNADFFDLLPGRCGAGDVPLLSTPAAVHFVHSFSAERPTDRGTIAAQWLANGAFAYVGSVHEPFLNAFVPTPQFVARIASGAPWAAAARHDGFKLWKVAVLGDPLYTLGPAMQRDDAAPELTGALTIADGLRAALAEKRYAEGLRTLALLGRDADAVKLGRALLDQQPQDVTPAVARQIVLPAFRAGDWQAVSLAFARLDNDARKDPALLDALWLSALSPMEDGSDLTPLELLRANLRAEMPQQDARILAGAWAKRFGRESATAMLDGLRRSAPNPWYADQIDRLVREGGW